MNCPHQAAANQIIATQPNTIVYYLLHPKEDKVNRQNNGRGENRVFSAVQTVHASRTSYCVDVTL